MKSSLDQDVAENIKNKEHNWETITDTSRASQEFCARCGRKRSDMQQPDGKFLPCRGFI